jgi:hypothetical protein
VDNPQDLTPSKPCSKILVLARGGAACPLPRSTSQASPSLLAKRGLERRTEAAVLANKVLGQWAAVRA